MPSLLDRQRELESALVGTARYVDVALALTRDRDGSTLLYAGGKWDKLENRFDEAEPSEVAVIPLEESQVEFATWFSTWLRDYREGYPRDISLALVAGDRRGGKTFASYFCQLAALIDVPRLPDGLPTIGWTISRTYRQRDELNQLISNFIPRWFYQEQRAPEFRFTFPHGSYLRNLSADDPDALKQGRVDFLLYNEGQLMSPRAVRNGMYGTSDRGGITVLTANPPSGPDGDWLRDLKEGIDEDPEIKRIAKFFNVSSKNNTKIDAPARRRVAAITKRMDPEEAEADAEGTWRRWGDLAYPAFIGRPFEKGGHIGLPPDDGFKFDVTSQVTRREFYAGFNYVIGGDFQRRPQAAAVLRVFQLPNVEGPVYWFVDEVGVKGTEVELSTELMGFPHSLNPQAGHERGAVWVGDCSGSYQGAERIKGRTSFGLLESEGWKIYPAEIIRGANSERPKNPDVAQRLGLMERLMSQGRIRVAPECVWLSEAFAKCQLRRTEIGTRVPKGQYAHITDAASYAVWRLEPKPTRGPRTPDTRGTHVANTRPRGPRTL